MIYHKVRLEDLVDTIRGLGEKFDSFHLSICICGAPMWQQPCSICSYYPMWSWDRQAGITHDHLRNCCDKEHFCKAVRKHGNILDFYLACFLRCVDPQRHLLDAAREQAKCLEFPEPEDIWEFFRRDDIDYRGKTKEEAVNATHS